MKKEDVANAFHHKFEISPTINTFCPGRVNLIGDHTDYNQGHVFPVAINLGTYVSGNKRADRIIRFFSINFGPVIVEFDLENLKPDEENAWSIYIFATLKSLLIDYPNMRGADFAVGSDLPIGGGLSSSASLEIAIIDFLHKVNKIKTSGTNAALTGQHAENNFVGCNSGIMDQLICALGQHGSAMLLDCRTLEYEYIALLVDYDILIVNSNVDRGLVNSEYNLRRHQCEEVAAFFNQASLRTVTLKMLYAAEPDINSTSFRRAIHVINENLRVCSAAYALQSRDIKSLSLLMSESHESLKYDFEVTTPELDGLVSLISGQLGDTGGVRMTGGGFGGCVVALVPKDKTKQVCATIEDVYPKLYGLVPDLFICQSTNGTFIQ